LELNLNTAAMQIVADQALLARTMNVRCPIHGTTVAIGDAPAAGREIAEPCCEMFRTMIENATW
jgi:hypothetical protein